MIWNELRQNKYIFTEAFNRNIFICSRCQFWFVVCNVIIKNPSDILSFVNTKVPRIIYNLVFVIYSLFFFHSTVSGRTIYENPLRVYLSFQNIPHICLQKG